VTNPLRQISAPTASSYDDSSDAATFARLICPVTATSSNTSAEGSCLTAWPEATAYSIRVVPEPSQPIQPRLPIGLNELLFGWRGRTGEIAEAREYTLGLLPLLEPADFGTRYDLTSHVEVPDKPMAWRSYSTVRVAYVVEQKPNPADELRRITDLPVDQLGEIFNVSRVTYHNWLREKPIALDHELRLQSVLNLLQQVRQIRTFDTESLRSWLITPIGIEGTTPLSLITAGKDDIVKAAAIRSRKPGTWTPLTSSLAFERTGLARSSVPRVGSRGWKASSGASDQDRLEQLLPAALLETDDPEEFETDEIADGRGLYIP
jgi:hypothetical protein